MPVKVSVVGIETIEAVARMETPGMCDTKNREVCITPDAEDDVFYHEMAHILYPHVSSEMFMDVQGIELWAKYGKVKVQRHRRRYDKSR